MFINELAEPTLLVIYPGRFQPFHKGHHAVYNWLTGKFGRNNVFITTSNKTDNLKSPFSFAEKAYFMQLTGVPADRIVQATSPYQIDSVLASGQVTVQNPDNTVVIFAVSEKDMAEDPRFSFAPKKDGTESFFQQLKDIKDTKSMKQHGYIMTVPTFDFAVLGKPATSASEIRAQYKVADKKTRQAIVKDLFGRYTAEAEQIMNSKLAPAPAPTGTQPVAEDAAGVGVVKGGRDPRYVMATTGDQNDVNASTPKKNLKAFNLAEEDIEETIRKLGSQYRLYSGKGKNLGTFPTRAGAEKHEREVQYFKHASEGVAEAKHQLQWTVEQHTNGHHNAFYLVKGHNRPREVWKDARGRSDFKNRAAAEAKAAELNSSAKPGLAETSPEKASRYLAAVIDQQTDKLGGIRPDMFGKIEKTFGPKGKQRKAGVGRAMDRMMKPSKVDEVTGDLPFDTMLSKIVAGGNLQTLAAKIVAKIKKFPQHVESDGYERDMPRYPDGHFYGADVLNDTFDEVMQQWKKMGPDNFSDEYGEESLFDVLDGSADYTRYWDGILKLRDRLQSMPGAVEQLGKMVWHGLFSGSVEQGITDIGSKGVAEGAIDNLEARRIEDLNLLMDEILVRFRTEKLPAHYRDALKQRLDQLKAERNSYYHART